MTEANEAQLPRMHQVFQLDLLALTRPVHLEEHLEAVAEARWQPTDKGASLCTPRSNGQQVKVGAVCLSTTALAHRGAAIRQQVTILRDDHIHLPIEGKVGHLRIRLKGRHNELHTLALERLHRAHQAGWQLLSRLCGNFQHC